MKPAFFFLVIWEIDKKKHHEVIQRSPVLDLIETNDRLKPGASFLVSPRMWR